MSPAEEPEVWSASLLWSLWFVLAGIASLACYSPARRVEKWVATHLAEKKEAGPAGKYRGARITEGLERSAKASNQALWLALFCFALALTSAFFGKGTVGTDELLWHYLFHKTIPHRALAITLLVGTTLVYSAVVWRAWQSSPFA